MVVTRAPSRALMPYGETPVPVGRVVVVAPGVARSAARSRRAPRRRGPSRRGPAAAPVSVRHRRGRGGRRSSASLSMRRRYGRMSSNDQPGQPYGRPAVVVVGHRVDGDHAVDRPTIRRGPGHAHAAAAPGRGRRRDSRPGHWNCAQAASSSARQPFMLRTCDRGVGGAPVGPGLEQHAPRVAGSSLSRAATTQPALPPPTTRKSVSIDPPPSRRPSSTRP